MDFELARIAHTVMRLRNLGVHDTRVLAAVEKISRAYFLPHDLSEEAYDDTPLPLTDLYTIPSAQTVGMLAHHLALEPNHTVLDIGTGSGFQAAVLSRLVRRLFTIERNMKLYQTADVAFKSLELVNIINRHGDGSRGWPLEAHFDRIVLSAATQSVHPRLFEQLTPGGFILAPMGLSLDKQKLCRISRVEGKIVCEALMESQYGPLVEDHSAKTG